MRSDRISSSSTIAEPRTRTARGTEPEGFRGKLDSAKKIAKAKTAPQTEASPTPAPAPTPTPTLVPPTVPAPSPPNGLDQLKALFGVGGNKPGAATTTVAAQPQEVKPPAPPPPPPPPPQLVALTPLEQAVHDLIGQLAEHEETTAPEGDGGEIAFVPQHAPAAVPDDVPPHAVKQAAPVREIAPPPEQTNPSHVNLVIENEGERVVVTVAVRGNDVNVSLRGSDEHTAAALARNAGTLDHALRARGLDLTDFSAERDRDSASQQQRSARDPRRERETEGERFVLEEHA